MGANKGIIRTTVIVVVMVVLVLGYYAYISNRKAVELQNTKVSEADRLILEDIENNYPKKPRDVVKLHIRMLQQIYAEELSDDKLSKMVDQMRLLYDDQLLNNQGNSKEEQVSSINAEIEARATERAAQEVISTDSFKASSYSFACSFSSSVPLASPDSISSSVSASITLST